MGERGNISAVMVGRKRTGKSTTLKKIALAYPKVKKALIINVNGAPVYEESPAIPKIKAEQFAGWKKGVYQYYDPDHERMLNLIIKHFRNGLIIFEDCTKYIDPNPSKQIKTFLVDHRMWNADLIFTFHSFKRVPALFWEMSTHVIIKKTQEVFDTPRNRNLIPNYEQVAEARRLVMESADNYYYKEVETLI